MPSGVFLLFLTGSHKFVLFNAASSLVFLGKFIGGSPSCFPQSSLERSQSQAWDKCRVAHYGTMIFCVFVGFYFFSFCDLTLEVFCSFSRREQEGEGGSRREQEAGGSRKRNSNTSSLLNNLNFTC
jgi:hypothetical protein